MRPLELTVEGFKSYREEQTFTFDGRTLFAIVGPTGAGKSSILEGIIYSLYGKTPRVERDTKKLINSSAEFAHVRLVFESDGASWEVTRAIRRKGASQVVLKPYGEGSPEAIGDRNVNSRIEELLGLDFGAFCSSVVLPQGEFDRFLKATAGDRSKILKGIFRLERVDALRGAAKEKSSGLDGRITALKAELGALPADPEMLSRLRADLTEEETRLASIKKELEAASKAEAALEGAQGEIEEIDGRISDSEAALTRMPAVDSLEKLASAEDERSRTSAATQKDSDKTVDSLAKAESSLEDARTATGGEEVIARVREMLRLRDRLAAQLASVESRLGELETAVANSFEAEVGLAADADEAEKVLARAREKLGEVERTHAAHRIRKGLKKGDPCPVCGHHITEIPRAGGVPALATAEKELSAAEKAARTVVARLEEARRAKALAGERFKTASEQVETGRRGIVEAESEIASLLVTKKDPSKEIDRREMVLKAAKESLDAARRASDEAGKRLRAAIQGLEQVTSALRRHAATLIEICGLLRIAGPEIDGDAAGLLDAAKSAHDTASGMIGTEQKKRAAIEQSVEAAARTVESFRDRFGVFAPAPLATALEDANATIGRIRKEIEECERAVVRSKEILGEVETLSSEKSLYDRLAADLSDSRFTAYLLDWERRLLAKLGSEKFYELTGRYRFDEEGEFQIIDTAAGTTRTADTLSGGETFLASLALALALAEAVSLEGGRLGCFFLDEGFGTLDVESLDLALEGIESLATPDRLIGLISHVGGIQARVDDLLILEKSEDGTTNVLQTEGPIAYPTATI